MKENLVHKVFINFLKDKVSMNLFHNISVKNGGKINESLLICHGKKAEPKNPSLV